MGRKIQGKKHRGIKDPRQQALARFESIVNKIDNPPSCIDDQEIPKRVLEIMQYKNKPKQAKQKIRKKKSKGQSLCILNFIPKDVMGTEMATLITPTGECDTELFFRLNNSCQETINEAHLAAKFNVQLQRDPKTGAVKNVQPVKKTETDAIIKEAKGKNKKKLSKPEKRRLKLIAKAQLKKESETCRDFSDIKDKVKFGEVVHRPPELTVLPKRKVKTSSSVDSPGQRDLLLKAMLDEKKKPIADIKKTKRATEDSEGRKQMLEEERLRVVELYRSLKHRKAIPL
ncbi:Uncharacterized protein GBIM_20483 [Gryllus bimaculatus]|nr:Uncharacterized protein GBIM_20483 [Gryllus bimaculatus]